MATREEETSPCPVPPASNITSQPGASHYLPPPCRKPTVCTSSPQSVALSILPSFLNAANISSVYSLPDPELCPGDTVIWSDVTTLVKILKDISTSRQIAATLSALPFLSSPAAPSFAPPRPTPGPQDLPKIQPQQELPLSYWASLALTGW